MSEKQDSRASKTASSQHQKPTRAIGIIFLAFIIFVVIVFLTQREDSINWVEDYHKGTQLAKQQNKPVLLAFYKKFTRMSTDTWNDTYKNPKVKEFVETNFVPILIDVDKQPDIAKKYNINYYPTHYVKRADSDRLFGPRMGYDPPTLFISELKKLLKKMNETTE